MSHKLFVETFDNGACGWIGWDGPVGPTPVEIRDSVAVSRSPWWVDCNHGEVDRSRLPEGFIMLDEVRIDIPLKT